MLHPNPMISHRANTWRNVLLPMLSALLVLHYAAFVGWGDLLRPTLGCEDEDEEDAQHSTASSLPGHGWSVEGGSAWTIGQGMVTRSDGKVMFIRFLVEALGAAAHLVLSWLGVERVQAPALVALFLALGACIMQVWMYGGMR